MTVTMRLSLALLAAACSAFAQEDAQVTTGELGDAIRITNNPAGAAYMARLTENPFGITGTIITLNAGEEGTDFAIDIDNLPTEGGPFKYHIHVDPVPSDGNCTGTLAHLDPYIRGETPACDAERPETCQVGDLSGKHGTMNGTSFRASYTDPYMSMSEGVGAFFGNRSITVHFANTTRIACGNFSSLSNVAQSSNAGASADGQGGLGATATLVPAAAGATSFVTPFGNGSSPTNVFVANGTAATMAPASSTASMSASRLFASDGSTASGSSTSKTVVAAEDVPTASATAQRASTNAGIRIQAAVGLAILGPAAVGIFSLF